VPPALSKPLTRRGPRQLGILCGDGCGRRDGQDEDDDGETRVGAHKIPWSLMRDQPIMRESRAERNVAAAGGSSAGRMLGEPLAPSR
jgi:hypothetical protein